jgi:hypothetical protein
VTPAEVKKRIFEAVSSLTDGESAEITDATPLIGDGSLLTSMKLVELCVLLEDLSADWGFEFDWTSDVALSRSRSMFRNAGALTAEFLSQMENKK